MLDQRFAAGLPISALGVMAKDLWTAVAFISIATACHQAWSANRFTVASDAFPSRAVGSVVGFGGMCGGIGGMLMLLVAGGMLQWLAALYLHRRHAPPRLDRDSRASTTSPKFVPGFPAVS